MNYPNAILKALLEILRSERERKGLNYEDFSAATGLHRTTLGLYERGERGPTVEAALNMARALGIPLSELLRKAESQASGNTISEQFAKRREIPTSNFRNAEKLRSFTGFAVDALRSAISDCYQTIDTIDAQLAIHGAEPLSKLVELANLSSMIGNLLGAGLADSSNGLYVRNRSHAYPDLIPQSAEYSDLEIKVALEKNKPKGHLPKPGTYITFRYVLCDNKGVLTKGKNSRGHRVFIWEVKVGKVTKEDFDISNTAGDSGKTAIIKTSIFNAMPLIYFDKDLLPYSSKSDQYPCFN
ncbi:MAG: hypothetical protein A3H42_05840 [Deltaproteobacteria bacterium RIFCSPLOWO2_02_FULL_46_8]|nr:MAG: hypothetical protein A3H42_05840 [Deltaproteobacteria bacterium RIFCSPLOWO2_02_FULL_46_8]